MPVDDLLLVRELGRGGMGTIWEARQAHTGQRVAVKCLHPEKSRSERAMARFRREAEALSRVRHPVIVPVLDARLEGDRPYLVMPYVDRSGTVLRALHGVATRREVRRALALGL